jgi:hypothetical protein
VIRTAPLLHFLYDDREPAGNPSILATRAARFADIPGAFPGRGGVAQKLLSAMIGRIDRPALHPGRRHRSGPSERGLKSMLWTIVVILVVLWLLGMVTSYTMGGLLHILLVLAVIVVVVRLIQGRRVL